LELKEVRPKGLRLTKVPVEVGPQLLDFRDRREEPHVSRIGFAQQGAKPIRPLLGRTFVRVAAEFAAGQVGPPQEVRSLAIVGKAGGSWGEVNHGYIVAINPVCGRWTARRLG
jgi:hypothetical protein